MSQNGLKDKANNITKNHVSIFTIGKQWKTLDPKVIGDASRKTKARKPSELPNAPGQDVGLQFNGLLTLTISVMISELYVKNFANMD